MQRFWIITLAALAFLTLGFLATADEKPAGKEGAARAFEKLKSLSGDWTVTRGPAEHGEVGSTVSYRVTAGGSAVMETLFAGTPHEMVTLIYLDGDDLVLTHYCMLHNQPHMRAEPAVAGEKIAFQCAEGKKGKIESEDHMHGVTFTFVDANHVKADWTLYKGGKPEGTHSFELERKKK